MLTPLGVGIASFFGDNNVENESDRFKPGFR
jgi:hypothetical protein